MCGIVGAITERNAVPVLLEGLHRLEYRGYDSAGIACYENGGIARVRSLGKVDELESAVDEECLSSTLGIAHTRWATHGIPSQENAHPHTSGEIAIVHNGIIENYEALKEELVAEGYEFSSQTDTEVVAHLIHKLYQKETDLRLCVQQAITRLDGAYALAVISADQPEQLIAARYGSPLVLGLGIGENFIGSDQLALLPVTNRFMFLEDGDTAILSRESIKIFDQNGQPANREVTEFEGKHEDANKGEYRHYMLKEIFEQPLAVQRTLDENLLDGNLKVEQLGPQAKQILSKVKQVQIIACGTSYHAGLVAKYWLEGVAGIPCQIEVASEFRYRKTVVQPSTLFVTISQSGETADTLAALRMAKQLGYESTLAVCNVASSSLVRESDLTLMTAAGPEVGVASTKAFTTQLVALLLLVIELAKRNEIDEGESERLVTELRTLPNKIEKALSLESELKAIAQQFGDKHHALFLGRGTMYPVAMEGALKLKEISYIHAESYPAGELKHGPLALVDENMPVIAVAPNDGLLEKLKSNLQEVKARGGQLFIFADATIPALSEEGVHSWSLDPIDELLAPILYTVPLQLLSYHVALIKGTDVDRPRNLAKSVTVE